MSLAVILPAAGVSSRFGAAPGAPTKLEEDLGGKPVLLRAVELFHGRPEVREILVAANPEDLESFKRRWADRLGFMGVRIVAGGKIERWETVQKALGALKKEITHVAVHDAARPVTDPRMIDRVIEAAAHWPAVIPALPVHATLKRVEKTPQAPAAAPDGVDEILGPGPAGPRARRVLQTVPRQGLWLVQTPQIFERELLERAYGQVQAGKVATESITDDAGLVEALGESVMVVEGDPMNVKITEPGDLAFAEAVLATRGEKPAQDKIGPKRKFPTWAQSEDE